MKAALAIVCSLLLLWTQFVQAQVPAASEVASVCACCACPAKCCAASSPTPESSPLSATPVSFSSQNLLLTVAPSGLVWSLPLAEASSFFPDLTSPFSTAGVPLYARDCARLI